MAWLLKPSFSPTQVYLKTSLGLPDNIRHLPYSPTQVYLTASLLLPNSGLPDDISLLLNSGLPDDISLLPNSGLPGDISLLPNSGLLDDISLLPNSGLPDDIPYYQHRLTSHDWHKMSSWKICRQQSVLKTNLLGSWNPASEEDWPLVYTPLHDHHLHAYNYTVYMYNSGSAVQWLTHQGMLASGEEPMNYCTDTELYNLWHKLDYI